MRSISLAISLLLLGCSRPPPPPEFPRLALDRLAPHIREQLEKAHQLALARPEDAVANGTLGMTLHAYEQHRAAAVCYRRARHFAPKQFSWVYYLGTVQAAIGNNTEAVAALREALRLDPEYLPAQVKLAETLLGLGEVAESRRLYEVALEKHPDFAAAHYGLARARSAQGNAAAGVQHFRRACELAPNFAAAHYALALAYQKTGETARAREHMALYQKDPLAAPPAQDPALDQVRALNTGPSHYLKKGLALEAAGRVAEAAAEHERALRIDPKIQQAHLNLITLYGRLNQPQQAWEHYNTLLELNPNLAESHYNYGVMLFGLERYREAGQAFERAVEAAPRYAEAHNNLGHVLERQGRLEQAMRHYRAAIENKPNYRLAHFHLGRLLLHQKRNAEAIAHFLETLTPEDEQTPGFLYGLGAAYGRTGDRPNALRYLTAAREKAAALGQKQLVASIERDLGILEGRP